MVSTLNRETEHDMVWHPFTQAKIDLPPITIKKASGTSLYDTNGKSYIDAISSWWVNLHGHAHPHITNALKAQLESLHQVIFAGCTHAPAKHLCERLSPLVPIEKPHFFF
jgi:adenosylmethionine---8-amino-7-oxononanoate aminotransferase